MPKLPKQIAQKLVVVLKNKCATNVNNTNKTKSKLAIISFIFAKYLFKK